MEFTKKIRLYHQHPAARLAATCGVVCLLATPALAAGPAPWAPALSAIKDLMTGTFATVASGAAFVWFGYEKAFGEGHHSRMTNTIGGVSMMLLPFQIISWLGFQ